MWGSVGRDHRGRIYVGASCESAAGASAHLLEFDPAKNEWNDRGGAVEQLKRLGLAKAGDSQNKIHTKILEAPDGFLYFASMDETGERDDGSALPIYGSVIWKMKPGETSWQFIKRVPEGLVTAAVGGSDVYFLGYHGHVVYRVDTKTGIVTNTRVGATGGHVSRNLLAAPGRVYVPRVRSGTASLVELNADLDELATHPLKDYSVTPDADSHGIVSFAATKDGSQYFCTDGGRHYAIKADGVSDLGLIHPDGPAYVSCLCSPDGERWLVGIGHKPTRGEPAYEWLVRDLKTGTTNVKPFTLPVPEGSKGVLVYGSVTRDDEGRWYVGGAFLNGPRSRDFTPAVWRIEMK